MGSLVVASSSEIRTGDLRVTASSSVPSFPAMSSATRFDHLTLRPRSRSSSPRRAAGVFIADFSAPARTPPPGFEPATSGLPRLELTAASTTATVPPRGTSGTFTGAAVAGTPAAARAAATAAASDRTSPPPPPPPPPPSTATNASPAPTGTIRGGSTAAASAPYAAADAALAPASDPFARCSAAAAKATRTASKVTGSNPASVELLLCRGVRGSGSAGAPSSSTSTSSWVGRTSSSASSSVSSPSVSVAGSVDGGFSFSFSFSFSARGRRLVILRTPGSSVPSSANSAHGRSRPAASDPVTHAGVTTGGWSRSDRASASSFAFVKR